MYTRDNRNSSFVAKQRVLQFDIKKILQNELPSEHEVPLRRGFREQFVVLIVSQCGRSIAWVVFFIKQLNATLVNDCIIYYIHLLSHINSAYTTSLIDTTLRSSVGKPFCRKFFTDFSRRKHSMLWLTLRVFWVKFTPTQWRSRPLTRSDWVRHLYIYV